MISKCRKITALVLTLTLLFGTFSAPALALEPAAEEEGSGLLSASGAGEENIFSAGASENNNNISGTEGNTSSPGADALSSEGGSAGVEAPPATSPLPSSEPEPTGGSCGEGIVWELSQDHSTLSILGSGNMTDYSSGGAPWAAYAGEISSVSVSGGIKHISAYGFENFVSLTALSLPSDLESIGSGAFYGCAALASFDVSSSLISIGADAFALCSGLSRINVDSPEHWAGLDCGPEGSGSPNINFCGIYHNGSPLNSYYWGDYNVCREIKPYSFAGCEALISVRLDSGCEELGKAAFARCPGLKFVSIPLSVNLIAPDCFEGSDSVRILYGGSREQWDQRFPALSAMDVVPESADKCVVEFNTDCELPAPETLYLTPGSSAELPVLSRPGYSFSGWYSGGGPVNSSTPIYSDTVLTAHWSEEGTALSWSDDGSGCITISGSGVLNTDLFSSPLPETAKEIIISPGIYEIGPGSFKNMAISSVSLPAGLVSIGEDAFLGCTELKEVNIDNIMTGSILIFIMKAQTPTSTPGLFF